jgi:metal-responsive CopG/Arc/MetJ family transcriptional regulator
MRTVQMMMDAELVERVDRVAGKLRMSRSSFARDALRMALRRYEEAELEARHQAGYRKYPSAGGEFEVPEQDRAWGDEPWDAGG